MRSEQVVLSDFSQIIQGGRLKLSGNDFVAQGFPAYGAGGLNGYLGVAEFNCEAVILSAIGARCGKCFHVSGQWTTLANTQIIIPDPDRADSRFLWHQLNDEKRWPRSGTGQPFIKPSDVKGHKVFLPPLEEQRRIAAILDRAQHLENLAVSQLQKSDALASSFFQKSIADARKQGALREECLGDISIVAGQYGASCSSAPYDTSLPRYVRITDIQDDGLLSPVMVSPTGSSTEWADLRLDPGDLLFARTGATVGKSYMYTSGDGDCVFAGYLIRFRLDSSIAIPEFVYGFTRSQAYRSWIASTQRAVAQPNINAKEYSSLTIPLPPIKEQEAYCATYRHIKKQTHHAIKRLANLSQLRQSLSGSLLDHRGRAL